MPTRIARIVASNSHVDYVGRVIDVLDAHAPPCATDYGFAQFVSLPTADDGSDVIGVVFNTLLVNPDYGNFGPRLSPPEDLSVLSPDYLNEQGVLVGILLLGWRDKAAINHHTVPRRVVPVGQDVYCLADEAIHKFHRDPEGRLQARYYSQIIAHAGPFAVPLIEAIIEQLEPGCKPEEQQQLSVLKRSLVWQRTLGGMRL